MNKTTTYILAVIAIIIVGGAFYFYNGRIPANIGGNDNTPATSATAYQNTQYGFSVSLPASWAGYTVVMDTWKGDSLDANGNMTQGTVSGPFISIRNPLWTAADPHQDIPIYVFTIQQWNDMQADKFHIGAAPINPSELARNANYVFALPARYNFAYQTGYEEVQQVIDAKSVTAF